MFPAGIILIGTGAVCVLAGVGLVVREQRKRVAFNGTSEAVNALTEFVKVLKDSPPWLVLILVGFLLMAGGGYLVQLPKTTAAPPPPSSTTPVATPPTSPSTKQ